MKSDNDSFRSKRWTDFCRRAQFSPTRVYHHPIGGWEYVPIHPFGDEPTELTRLNISAESCISVDAWWGIGEDATLLESRIGEEPGLFVKPTSHPERYVYLVAVFAAPFVTRALFEQAMSDFVVAGFPHDPKFRLKPDDPWLRVA